ncbi:hypothetical protein [Clostridium sp. YIM B02569]|uniref:hypothetical protein n=1 Tax=Clostridium sp. YIM B02569 TaxID=2911967 RepID=UPI001EEACB09|nr:hypothetical protein [Clostridium sp. YIM B02569]
MNSEIYNYFYDNVKKRMGDLEILSLEEINSMLEEMYTMSDVDKSVSSEFNDIIEVSKMGCLVLGLLALFFKNSEKSNKVKGENVVYSSLLTTIANNSLAIMKLILIGFDYQVGILLRSTYELFFTLLTIMLDKKKCDLYYDSARLNNSNEIWRDNFRMKDMNAELEGYENSITNNSELKFFKKWRKTNYSYYSKFVHNSFFTCFSHCHTYSNSNEPEDLLKYNLWGGNVTRVQIYLTSLNDLTFWGIKYFYSILKNSTYINTKELLLNNGKSILENAMALSSFYESMFLKIEK